jgi:hypothetical protein
VRAHYFFIKKLDKLANLSNFRSFNEFLEKAFFVQALRLIALMLQVASSAAHIPPRG